MTPYLTKREFMEVYRVSDAQFRHEVKNGHLTILRPTRNSVLIRASDAAAWKAGPLPPPPILDGFIYFIDDGFFIKIGFSKDPKDRMIKLQTASPFKLKLMHTTKGNRLLEAEIHQKFRHLRSQGEWFRGERELRQYIREMKP